MGKTKKIIKAIGISTAIVLTNTTLTVAEELSNSSDRQKPSVDLTEKKPAAIPDTSTNISSNRVATRN